MELKKYQELQGKAVLCLSEEQKESAVFGFEGGYFNELNAFAPDLAHFIQYAILDIIPLYGRKKYQFSSTFKEKRKVTAVSRTIEFKAGKWESRVQLMVLTTGRPMTLITYKSVYNQETACLEQFEREGETISQFELIELLGFLDKTTYVFPDEITYDVEIMEEVFDDEEESDESDED